MKQRREIENAWLTNKIQFVVCTSAFGLGINKPDVRWVVHFHSPLLLSEYIQEVGRGGRDGKKAEALTLVSEPTGLLDPEDKQRSRFFEEQQKTLYQKAQQISQKLPKQGPIETVTQQFPSGAIALSILHSNNQLNWQDPFNYQIKVSSKKENSQKLNNLAVAQMSQYLNINNCRWQFLLQAFGFNQEAKLMKCGHCDRCQK
jgi:ATP-dependent DNA helicase RecQ